MSFPAITVENQNRVVEVSGSEIAVITVGVQGLPGSGGGGGGSNDHGELDGLADDDHAQYHNDARGDARYYTQSQVDTALSGKANASHSHAISDVTGLQTELDDKLSISAAASAYQPLATVLTNTTAAFTTAQESKLAGIAAGAEVNVNSDWNAGSGDAQILNKPTLGTAAAQDVGYFATAAQGALADSALQSADIGVSVQAYSAVLAGTTASFTTADETKLDGIEAGADVTDATNVADAGAVMESDYSPSHSILVQQSGTGTPTALSVGNNTLLGRLSGGGSDIDDLSASQVRTLLNVEDGADVTDTANVTAAGALMDSEVTNLAAVKSFDPTAYATAAQGALADSAVQLNTLAAQITCVFDGMGAALVANSKVYFVAPYAMTIQGWTLVADQSGSLVIDVWKDTYANFPPTSGDSIAGTEKPTLSAAAKNQDNTLSTWTASVAAGDTLIFNIDSATTVEKATLLLTGVRA